MREGGRGSKIFAHLASSQKLSELCAGCNRAKLFPPAGTEKQEPGAGRRVKEQGSDRDPTDSSLTFVAACEAIDLLIGYSKGSSKGKGKEFGAARQFT